MLKVIVFDLGGTLMQYVGMPHSWVDFYLQGFEAINEKYGCSVSEASIEKSVELLKGFNPRVKYREIEYSAEFIFEKILVHWNIEVPLHDCIETFWSVLKLKAEIYTDTIPVLKQLRKQGYVIATLTDLPNAMPDEIFKKDISDILSCFDYYMSSAVAGYRKPNSKGLQMISEKYSVPITELIFVGDEEKDRQTAANAKCRFVHIDREKKKGQGISDLYELLEVQKTLIINGSPRINGDTVSLINIIKENLLGEVRVVDAYRCNITPCFDCRFCWENKGCSIKDEMQDVYDYIQDCDNILIASPIYFSELTGKLLDVGSRLQTYFCAKFFRKEEPIAKPKKGAVLLVGGGDGRMNKAYETACTLLHHMNCHNVYELVFSHNTNERPAIKDKQVLNRVDGIIAFFNDIL